MIEYELWQDDMCVASVSCNDEAEATRELLHYAMLYGQDGPIKAYKVVREVIKLEGMR